MMRFGFKAGEKLTTKEAHRRLTAIDNPDRAEAVDELFDVLSDDDRTLTAQVLAQARADICALQEVENLITLTAFHNRYLRYFTRKRYGFKALYEGNDARGIDVALLARKRPQKIRSHAGLRFKDLKVDPPDGMRDEDKVFRRDCLMAEFEIGSESLTLFNCHFKSMHGGRAETKLIREAEARGVKALIDRQFKDSAQANWIILGDLNDYFEIDGKPQSDHGLSPLLGNDFAFDLAKETLKAPLNRWSHHYSKKDYYTALDHMLLSPALMEKNRQTELSFIRIGQPYRAERYEGHRLPGIGWATPKASDHCPLVADIQL